MLDMFHLPPSSVADVQMFMNVGNWSEWVKPKGKSMTMMYCIGSGAGDGGAHTAATTNARGGGGGGGAGGMARLVIPTMFLPNVLMCYPGKGGMGGAAQTDGIAGELSYISHGIGFSGVMGNLTAVPQVILQSGAVAAALGAKGTAAVPGAAGAGSTIATAGTTVLGYSGLWSANVGPAGMIGGAVAGAVGTACALFLATPAFLPWSGGAGGAGSTNADYAGGTQTAIWPMNTMPGPPVALPNGGGGASFLNPLMSLGGNGGAALTNGIGGNGGSGGYPASGGGGGGAGVVAGGGSQGGAGAGGLIIIISW